jgi:hypothetical protein
MTESERRHPGNEEVIAHVDATMDRHVKVFHAFTADELRPMVREHKALINDIHGEPHPTAADPDHREGGIIAKLDEAAFERAELKKGQDEVVAQLANGGVKAKIPGSLYGTIIVTGGSILVAIIYALSQTHTTP